MMPLFRVPLMVLAFMVACAAGEIGPAPTDPSSACAGCRMMVSDLRFAAQLVAPGEEPRFFDDIGCMRKSLSKKGEQPPWTGFVSDYRTRQWVPAAGASYWKCDSIETPMSSHIVAVKEGTGKPAPTCVAMTAADVYGAQGPPRGAR